MAKTRMSVVDATQSYERWLGKRMTLNAMHLEHKHELMAQGAFPFMRATFYRFIARWAELAGDAGEAPEVLALGDLHVENFGTWRDAEGRLVWGVNDFDEVYPLPYTVDLARLAMSAHLAASAGQMAPTRMEACNAILAGYQDGMAMGGQPFVLAESHKWLRDTMTGGLRDPVQFWGRMNALDQIAMEIPKAAERNLERLLPKGAKVKRVVLREAGLGSLGRPRFVLLGQLSGAQLARETKALCASACVWAGIAGGENEPMYGDALRRAVRASDPFVSVRRNWIVRRLAPYCSRVELAMLPKQHDQLRLLRAMGFETANVHLGTPGAAKRVLRDLKGRPPHWLHHLAKVLEDATVQDFEEWRKRFYAGGRKTKP